jgi:pilus assembly protein FimV
MDHNEPDAHDATALPVAEARVDDNTLDFDLGGLSFEPVSSNESVAMAGPGVRDLQDETAVPDLDFALDPLGDSLTKLPADVTAAPAAAEEPYDLAFDMNFGEPQASPEPSGEPARPVPGSDLDMAGLAAEFDLPPLPQVTEAEAPAAGQDPLFDLDMMDFGLPATAAAPAAVAAATPFHEDVPAILAAPVPASLGANDDPLFDLDTMDFGSPAEASPALAQPSVEPFEFDAPPALEVAAPAAAEPLPFDFSSMGSDEDPFALPQFDAAPAGEAMPTPGLPAEPSFDLSDIDLDLPGSEPAAVPEPLAAVAEPAALSPEQMEMETKLDLALAYQEIGDKEGARELLDEVIKGGSSEQASKASAMRSLLA